MRKRTTITTRTTTLTAASDNVLVALSGGVDSSVAAALLVDAGHTVTGITCIFAGTDDASGGVTPTIPTPESLEAARAVAAQLGIEHKVIDVRERFEHNVLEPFACGYARGETPNPCVVCNPSTKFGALFDAADELGCDRIATGHYALVEEGEPEDTLPPVAPKLKRGSDGTKDQSYFLYRLVPEMLARLVFPLAGLTKEQVRAIAREKGLPTAESPESQDACFADEAGGYIDTIKRFFPEAFTPGDIVDIHGTVLGVHAGIARYTVGQRKGLGISAPHPLYVKEIDAKNNAIVVASVEEILVREFTTKDAIIHAPLGDGRFEVKIRHGMEPVWATVTLTSNDVTAPPYLQCILDEPLSGVAPGQSLVCYRGSSVICGGIIA